MRELRPLLFGCVIGTGLGFATPAQAQLSAPPQPLPEYDGTLGVGLSAGWQLDRDADFWGWSAECGHRVLDRWVLNGSITWDRETEEKQDGSHTRVDTFTAVATVSYSVTRWMALTTGFGKGFADNSEGDKNSAIFLTGMPDHHIEDITIKDVQFIVSGGGTQSDADREDLNEYTLEVLKGHWPEFSLVGTLPAAGVFCRHMKGLTLSGISIRSKTPDARPGLKLVDVTGAHIRDVTFNGKPVR